MKQSKQHEVDEAFFELIEFNTRRLARGAEAAKVRIDRDGNWLWMSKRDLKLNIKEFGPHAVLVHALKCYEAGRLLEVTEDADATSSPAQ
jgi:hypothetical protein